MKKLFLIVILFQLYIFIYYIISGNNILIKLSEFRNILKQRDCSISISQADDDLLFNEAVKQKYLFQQEFFCRNQILLNNTLIEERIKVAKVRFDDETFEMFVYKTNDFVSNDISLKGVWDYKESKILVSALHYYSKKKKITNKETYVLDLGANIGWYSLLFGKQGYNLLSFEPSKINLYILLKNYCLNSDINMIIINKGLDINEKKSTLYHPLANIGDAIEYNNEQKIDLSNYMKEEIVLTKLNNYIAYLSSKNLALLKIDVEGSECKAIEGGIDLIVKYHIPFIFMEWNSGLLKSKCSDLKSFLELFENNGYKISKIDFLSKQYCSINDIIDIDLINIYIVYTKFLE